jgi:uncharacterized hydrophobic protein (TIGR00271 family)
MKLEMPRAIMRMQDRLVYLLGTDVEGRSELVASMLRRDKRESIAYWLQLCVSVGIATLGLVVGSSAVVIGAMLVAPLMAPIVALAMGLAARSPFLVLRTAGRIALSVAIAVGGAAGTTLLLPFHELNAEISARASPTLLDLMTAAFCALAGVYASLNRSSNTATTAAGTAISLSLVPPLCASGFGLGAGAWHVARGAALLFLTNLVAIVVVGTVAFVATGFNRVRTTALEREELEQGKGATLSKALARQLTRLFASRAGPVLRFLMPFVLLAALFVPLERALNEVAWEVRVRGAVSASLAREPSRLVESKVRVERHEVEIVVVLLGTAADAEDTRARLVADIEPVSGVTPHIEVLAVPDATAFAGLESTLLKPRIVETHPVAPAPSPDEQLDAARARVRSAVGALWPTSAAGEPLAVDVGTGESGSLRVRVVHIGPSLGTDGAEALRRGVEAELGRQVLIIDVAVPAEELTDQNGALGLVSRVASAVRVTAGVAAVSVCAIRPAAPTKGRRASPAALELARALDELLATHPRVTTTTGDAWSIRFVQGSCPSPAAADAGAPDDGGTK